MLDEDGDLAPLAFVGSATIDTPVEQLVADIRGTLKLPLSDYRAARNSDLAFRLLRSHAEQAGIFVLLLGNLGSYHTDLDVKVFRGFALADEFAPFIVVNPRDSAGARSFTLLHELVHLWLGEPGVSGGYPMDPVEVFCNRVASTFLLPDEELDALRGPNTDDIAPWAANITEFATSRNVSASMVAYRLHRRAAIGQDTWLGLQNLFRNRRLESRERQRQKLAAMDSGPPYGVLVRHNVGPGLVDLTFRLEAAGSLTATKAGKVLGVNPRNTRAVLAAG